MARLLIIDDDAELCALLKELLEGDGFAVDVAGEGARDWSAPPRAISTW